MTLLSRVLCLIFRRDIYRAPLRKVYNSYSVDFAGSVDALFILTEKEILAAASITNSPNIFCAVLGSYLLCSAHLPVHSSRSYTSLPVERHICHSTGLPLQQILDNRDCFPCNIVQEPARYDYSGCILMLSLFFFHIPRIT